ncbi:uncharacterized protein [Dermacentor albipictus]|uniref:uncharacterized protein isoform X1 n=1 Tax=Dermacentor albipictus TaxID=60249 RepID=UPI0031FE3398
MCTTVSVGVPGNEPTATKEGFADVLRRADEEMQWLIGATLTVLVGLVLGSAFLVSWACVCLEIFRDIRQSVLILWDTMHFRDPSVFSRHRILEERSHLLDLMVTVSCAALHVTQTLKFLTTSRTCGGNGARWTEERQRNRRRLGHTARKKTGVTVRHVSSTFTRTHRRRVHDTLRANRRTRRDFKART